MANAFYTPSGTPATNAQGSSSDIRSEFALIEAGLDKLPALTADYVIKVNAGGTALEPVQFLAVAQGGTGAATLTDGGILVGSGTGAITALAVLADGEMLVGDGTTDPAIESGATLRTSIGVGTTDAVSFASLSLTSNLAVSDGGTGVGTLTDGGILLGSGTNAITATAVLADGEMLVGDGTTDPAIESGATLRTSIGVGTGDSPTFAGLTVSGDAIVTVSASTTSTRIGLEAGESIASGGTNNTAIGYRALSDVTTTDNCTAIGSNALKLNTAFNSTAIGASALAANTSGAQNTAVGYNSLNTLATNSDCTSIGYQSLTLCTGGQNTAIGSFAGDSITTGTANTLIGYNTAAGSATASNRIIIGIGVSGTADDQISIGRSGNVVSNDFGTDALWSRISDVNRKTEVKNSELGLDFINALRVVTYKWKAAKDLPKEWGIDPNDKIDTDIVMTGLIAQEVEAALKKANIGVRFPGWVQTDKGQRISGEAYIFPLINAVHTLTDRLEALEAKINA
mgnify:FL=1|tara:strand:+ start:38710 stop:40248 length:1539 start_codon:yes stop_codon:yes gene_type:complete